jgi:hypothetical protein
MAHEQTVQTLQATANLLHEVVAALEANRETWDLANKASDFSHKLLLEADEMNYRASLDKNNIAEVGKRRV